METLARISLSLRLFEEMIQPFEGLQVIIGIKTKALGIYH
jgi:hypothetical protein